MDIHNTSRVLRRKGKETESATATPQANATQSMTKFSQLPTELRQEIFKQLFPETLFLGIRFKHPAFRRLTMICLNAEGFIDLTALLEVSSQVHGDASQAIRDGVRGSFSLAMDFLNPATTVPSLMTASPPLRVEPPQQFVSTINRFKIRMPLAFEPRRSTSDYFAEDASKVINTQDLVGVLTVTLHRVPTPIGDGPAIGPWEVQNFSFKAVHLPSDYSFFLELKKGIQATVNYINGYVKSAFLSVDARAIRALNLQICSFREFRMWDGQLPAENIGNIWRKMDAAQAKTCYDAALGGEEFCSQPSLDDGKKKRAEDLGVGAFRKRRKSMSDLA